MRNNFASFVHRSNTKIAAIICFVLLNLATGSFAQTEKLDRLFQDLKTSPDVAARVEQEIWQEWRKSGSDSIDLLLQRGRNALANNAVKRAIGHLSTVIDHAPDFAEAWNLRATAYYMQGEFALSVSDIEKTLALNPRHFGAMSGLGLILERTGRLPQALIVFEEVLKIHPHSQQAQDAKQRITAQMQGTAL